MATDVSEPRGFDILYEQGPCLAVCKPGALLTQAPPGIDSLEVRLKQFLKVRDSKPGRVYLGVPHRLDRPASGVLVFGRHVRAARRLSEQFQGRTVRKLYWALVEGNCELDEGLWQDHLRKVPDQARAEVVESDHPDGRLATLRFQVIQRMTGMSLLNIELQTGRTHQIRVQAASRGHAIRGDDQYGAEMLFGPICEHRRDRCIALHARSLSFRHPMTGERVTVTAPLPQSWLALGITASQHSSS